jgi:dipeptidyl aminopeptidase/acylaminoacyl peptidase
MFDPAEKIFLDVREQAGISEDWSCAETTVSPDGRYVWMAGWDGSYLVDLTTFESQYYPRKIYLGIDWSPNSKFAWLYNSDPTDKTDQYSILSITDKEIRPLPVIPLSASIYRWHENDDTLIYPSEDKKNLIILDASTLSFWELPFKVQGPPYYFDTFAWDLNGEKIALEAKDGSLWQVDYPKLENLEQLTPSLPDVSNVHWSPDSNSIAFISGSDIYVVETN